MTDPLCIDAGLMGTERNLLVDNGYRWIKHVPIDAWHFSGNVKLHSDRCLDTLLALNGVTPDTSPPSRFVKAMSLLMAGSSTPVPWSQVMPDGEHRAFVRKLINSSIEALDLLSRDYYTNTWVPQSVVLRGLQPARVSPLRFQLALQESGNNSRAIESFRPDSDCYAQEVEYNRFGTRTGRLTVASGPDILTLKRSFRDVIQPNDPDGSIMYLDFAALEARVLLHEAGGRCDDADMYTFISRELFDGSVPRDAIKQAVISELYGSGKYALGETLGIEGDELNNFVGKVKHFFKTKELLKRVKDEFIKTGKITNRHGRQLVIEEPLDRILINTYAQSTGVDVSLLGFSEVVKQLEPLKGVRPLFVLHDALLLDVPAHHIDEVKKFTKVHVPGYVQAFHLKCETISCTP